MSSLSSASSLDTIVASYVDNASYAEDASATKAAAFVTACRILLLKRPQRVRHGNEEIELKPDEIRFQLREAQNYLANTGQHANGVTDLSFSEFRQ